MSSRPASMPRANRRVLCAVLAGCMLLAACGSTVPAAQQQAALGETDGGLAAADTLNGTAPSDPAATTDESAFTTGTGATAAGGDTSAAGTTAAGAPAGSAGTTAASSGTPVTQSGERRGPGVTDKKIYIGVVKVKNAGAANESIGANVSGGDPNLQQNAMIKHINATGGLAGRELVPVEYELDENTTQTQAQIEQEQCETWTKDNKVFAGVTTLASDLMKTCMEQAGATLIGSSLSTADARTFAQFPHYYEIAGIRLDRQAKVYPRGLAQQGYFSDDAVVGVVSYETPAFMRATQTVLLPELERLGVETVEPAYVPFAITPAELGGSSAGISNAVLRFRQQGVTHVMFLEAGAILSFLWFPQAESQGYRPRYGLNSQSGPVTHSKENEQLRNALAIGWVPYIDVGDTPQTQQPPRFRECLRIMRAAGARYDSADPNAKRVSGSQCDSFWFLQSALRAAGRDLTADGFARGVATIGGRFQTSHSYGVDLRRRRDGASVVRPTAYNGGCECWRYSGGARPAPG